MLGALAGLLMGVYAPLARAETGVTSREVVIGQSLDLSGPLTALAPDIVNATNAYVDAVNVQGGVHGRRIRIVTQDDGYVPDNTVRNVRRMIEEDPVFAFMNLTGTANVAAALPLLAQQHPPVPLVAPFTGAGLVRHPALAHVFNLRASYADETEKLVQHLSTLGIQRIGVLWSHNEFGKDGLAGVQKAMQKRHQQVYAQASIEANGSDADRAVAALHDARPEVIIMITAGKPTVDFIKAYNRVRKGMRFYTLSVMGTQSTLRALGADGVGVVVTSVVPFPWSATHAAAREYRSVMALAGHSNLSFLGFESYLNARLVVEGLRRAGKDLTRARFIAALESMKKVDLGGFDVGFSPESHQGSRFVDLTIIGPGEKFIK